jgi:hypothetical protein
MNEHIKNTWNWIKEHKKEIAIAGAISIVSAVGGIVLYKKIEDINATKHWMPPKLNISDTGIDDNLVRHHDGATEVSIYEDIPLAALGKFGEYLAENIPNLPDNPIVAGIELAIVD